jgi:hypothetical protein
MIRFPASDNRLYLVAEALDESNKWMRITSLTSSFCGNSRHKVLLDSNEYWTFKAPIFKGSFQTKLRYTLYIGETTRICSNEIPVRINKTQFDKAPKKETSSINYNDPYWKNHNSTQ